MDKESYKQNLEFSIICPNIIPTFGIHPWKITNKVPDLDVYDNYIKNSKGIPLCNKCKGIIKPDVTLYEEPVNEYAFLKARFAIEQADLLS